MNARNPIIKATFIVFATIWIAMNLYTLFTDPAWFWENIPNMVHGAFVTLVGCVMGVVITAGLILLERSLAQMKLQGGSFNGVQSSIGPVPILAPPAKRTKAKECLPIESERVRQWIEANKTTNPDYVNLFMAIWQTLSAHKTHPASYRKGGHGGRTLAQHCMAVADTALELAPGWSYEGVYIKRPGKSPKLIIAKRDANYVFDPLDPIIPVLGLAHDLGKIEAYKLQANGTVLTSESGSEQDHAGVKHDRLGARILARISEFWELPPRDTRTLSRVIAHYHHPSDFPVDKDGLSIDDRMTALMEFLILADKTTGQRESGISAATANEDTISETEAEEIYAAFVSCITEKGRINGTGDVETDKVFKIGQKHAGLVYLREAPLLASMCRKLGVSIEAGMGRFILLNRILTILNEKGLLSTIHNGVDFKAYQPAYFVRFYHSQENSVIASWPETIIISPAAKHAELLSVVDLPGLMTVAKIERPSFAHLSKIADPSKLLEMTERAFGQPAMEAVRKALDIGEAAVSKDAQATPNPALLPTGRPVMSQATPIPVPDVSPIGSTGQNAVPTTTTSVSPVPLPVSQDPATPAAIVGDIAPGSHTVENVPGIDCSSLDDEVKHHGFEASKAESWDAVLCLDPDRAPDTLLSVPSIEMDGDALSLSVPSQDAELTADDLDMVAVGMPGEELHEYDDPMETTGLAAPAAMSNVPEDGGPIAASNELAEESSGIPGNHDLGTAIQDVPKDPVSKYKKQKQEEKNIDNLTQLRQSASPSQFLQELTTENGKKRGARKLAASLGTGSHPTPLSDRKREATELSNDPLQDVPGESPNKASYEVFQRLVQRSVENGSLHLLAELDGKYFILQSMLEKAFPNKDIDEQLPAHFVDRRPTRAGTVLLIPVRTGK
jgi:hypothetical protein